MKILMLTPDSQMIDRRILQEAKVLVDRGHEVTLLAGFECKEAASYEQDGIRIFVDADSLPMVDGTEIDFLKQGLNEQFVFRNPNVAGECGCGSSFTTDADRAA